MQFETCTFHGFEKKLIVAATKDSSVVALDRDTGNMLSTKLVHPKKPSRSLYMQILGNYILSCSSCSFTQMNHEDTDTANM